MPIFIDGWLWYRRRQAYQTVCERNYSTKLLLTIPLIVIPQLLADCCNTIEAWGKRGRLDPFPSIYHVRIPPLTRSHGDGAYASFLAYFPTHRSSLDWNRDCGRPCNCCSSGAPVRRGRRGQHPCCYFIALVAWSRSDQKTIGYEEDLRYHYQSY